MVNMRDIQRTADGDSKAILVIGGFGGFYACKRIRPGIERRAAIVVENGAVWLVHIEVAEAASTSSARSSTHGENHGSAPAKASSAESPLPAAKPAKVASPPRIAQLIDPVLHFSRIDSRQIVSSHSSRNCDGFGAALGQSGIRKPGVCHRRRVRSPGWLCPRRVAAGKRESLHSAGHAIPLPHLSLIWLRLFWNPRQ